MVLPEGPDEPDEPAIGPLLPPEDRLWRHPSELRSHPISPANPPTERTAPPPPAAPNRGRLVTLAAFTCLAGLALVGGVLWVTWPRQSTEVAGGHDSSDEDPSASEPSPITATAPGVRFTDLFSAGPSGTSTPSDPITPRGPTETAPARLGVQIVDFSTVEAGPLPPWRAARVVEVEAASAAERIGLQPGDLILAADHERVAGAADLVAAVDARAPGDQIDLLIARIDASGSIEPRSINVRLGS